MLRHRIKAQRTTKIESQQIYLISSFFSSFLLSFLSLFFCLFLPSCILLLFFTSFLPSFVLSFFMCIQLPQLISKMTQIKIPQSWNYHYLESDIFLWREEELSCGMFGSAPGFKQQDARRIFPFLSTSWHCNKLSFPGGQNFTWLRTTVIDIMYLNFFPSIWQSFMVLFGKKWTDINGRFLIIMCIINIIWLTFLFTNTYWKSAYSLVLVLKTIWVNISIPIFRKFFMPLSLIL